MEAITGAVANVFLIVSQIFTFMLENPLVLLFIGASLIPLGVGIFKAMKDSVA